MPTADVSIALLASLASLVAAGLFALLLLVALRSRRKKSARGDFALLGRLASVEEPLGPVGSVLVDGELWRARVADPERGAVGRGRSNVRVTGARGHLLLVEPLD